MLRQAEIRQPVPEHGPRPHRLDHVARLGSHYRGPHRGTHAGDSDGRPDVMTPGRQSVFRAGGEEAGNE
ncbi:hypothetical protein PUN4_570195 [Paraburkholderia unamae]|nr:hypothetical protein PUN4_570195 [Paraburkholderia unamae]